MWESQRDLREAYGCGHTGPGDGGLLEALTGGRDNGALSVVQASLNGREVGQALLVPRLFVDARRNLLQYSGRESVRMRGDGREKGSVGVL